MVWVAKGMTLPPIQSHFLKILLWGIYPCGLWVLTEHAFMGVHPLHSKDEGMLQYSGVSVKSALTLTVHIPPSLTGILPWILLTSEPSCRTWVSSGLWFILYHSRSSRTGVLKFVHLQHGRTPKTHLSPNSLQSLEIPFLNSSRCDWISAVWNCFALTLSLA